jgi:hypothetical protein
MSADPQLRHDSDMATIQSVEHDLLRYRLERAVGGSGVNAVDGHCQLNQRRARSGERSERAQAYASTCKQAWGPGADRRPK